MGERGPEDDLFSVKFLGPGVSDCLHVKSFVDALSDIQSYFSHMLLDVLLYIEQLVRHVRPPTQRQRHTRSWLPFLGNVLKMVTRRLPGTTGDIKKGRCRSAPHDRYGV